MDLYPLSHSLLLLLVQLFLLLLLLFFAVLTFLTTFLSLPAFPFFFLPSLGRSKVKSGLPVPSFLEFAYHANHVIQVEAGSALHVLSDWQSLGLDSQLLRSHHTGILEHCAVNQSSEDEYIFFIDSVQCFLCIWAEVDHSLLKILAEDANILFVGSQSPMLISHSLHLCPYSSLEPAEMYTWWVSRVLDSLHDELDLISKRFVLLFIHFPLVCQIQDHHLTCRHRIPYSFLLLFLLGLNIIQISPSLCFGHRRQHFLQFLEICLPPVFSFFLAILMDLSDQLLDPLFGLLLPRFVALSYLLFVLHKFLNSLDQNSLKGILQVHRFLFFQHRIKYQIIV